MPNMLPEVVPLIVGPLIDFLKGKSATATSVA